MCVHCGQPIEYTGRPPRWRHTESGMLMCRVNGTWMREYLAAPAEATA